MCSTLGVDLAGCTSDTDPGTPLQTVEHVDLSRYTGQWHEIARLPNRFQSQCERQVTATYEHRDDGRLSVVNRCITADREMSEARGVARVGDPRTNARLEVSFVDFLGIQLFWGDYWIIGLADDYRYAVIGTPSRDYGWILARTPELPNNDRQRAFAILREQGYDPAEFISSKKNPGQTPIFYKRPL